MNVEGQPGWARISFSMSFDITRIGGFGPPIGTPLPILRFFFLVNVFPGVEQVTSSWLVFHPCPMRPS